jgi:glycosyltransferase involved in cell wall biosynthesis
MRLKMSFLAGQSAWFRGRQSSAKTLLVTDIPPCVNYAGGIFTKQMLECIDFAIDDVFVLLNKSVTPEIPEELRNRLKIRIESKPIEQYSPGANPLHTTEGIYQQEISNLGEIENHILPALQDFASRAECSSFWLLLEGQSMIRLAYALMNSTQFPIHVQVMDPPASWLRAHCVDPESTREVLKKFHFVMSNARSCAAASWTMAERYQAQYSIPSIPVVPSLPKALVKGPSPMRPDGPLRIGFAGQIYARREWDTFLDALERLDWRIDGRAMKIHAFAQSEIEMRPEVRAHVHFESWRDVPELVAALAECDLFYCPYSFDASWREDAELCFPSKLVVYLASGRPVFYHGPPYASPARFLSQWEAGFLCHSQDAAGVAATLTKVLTHRDEYHRIAHNGTDAFYGCLTHKKLARSLHEFLFADGRVRAMRTRQGMTRTARIRQRAKQILASLLAGPNRLGQKSAFATIWLGVAIDSFAKKWRRRIRGAARRVFMLLPVPLHQSLAKYAHGVPPAEASAEPANTGWKTKMRQRLKRVLTRVPAVQVYLAEKQILQEAAEERDQIQVVLQQKQNLLEITAAERDALIDERAQLHAEVEAQREALTAARERLRAEEKLLRIGRDGAVAERDALAVERARLNAEIERQRVAFEGLVAERDALAVERIRLEAEVERQVTAAQVFASERDALLAGQQELLGRIEIMQVERTQLFANTAQLKMEFEKVANQSQQERAQYHDAMLGKLVTVQSQFNTFQRSLLRLGDIPSGAIANQLSRDLYLDLLEESLIGTIIKDESIAPWHQGYDQARRELGRDWPKFAFTMIGKARMRNLRELTETVLNDGVPGDLLEAGVWRGGACIYMRGILMAQGIIDRAVWVADSFAGLPLPNAEQYPADKDDTHHTMTALAVSLEEVRDNFARFGLLDEQVRFLKGWFKDTLPQAPVKRLALLRLDGDMYESTIQTLDGMYWKLSPRGVVIIDDYFLPACRKAVDDFRNRHRIMAKIEMVDGAAVYWRKQPSEKVVVKTATKRKERV